MAPPALARIVAAALVAAAVAPAIVEQRRARSWMERGQPRSPAAEGLHSKADPGCVFFDNITATCVNFHQAVDALADASSMRQAMVALPEQSGAVGAQAKFEAVHRYGEWLALNLNRFDAAGLWDPDTVLTHLMRRHQQRIKLCLEPKEKVPKFDDFAARAVWFWSDNVTLTPWMKRWPHSDVVEYGYFGHVYHAYLWSLPVTSWASLSANDVVLRTLSICDSFDDDPFIWECYHGIGHALVARMMRLHSLYVRNACATFARHMGSGSIDVLVKASQVTGNASPEEHYLSTTAYPCKAASAVWKVRSCCSGVSHSSYMYGSKTSTLSLNDIHNKLLKGEKMFCPE